MLAPRGVLRVVALTSVHHRAYALPATGPFSTGDRIRPPVAARDAAQNTFCTMGAGEARRVLGTQVRI